MSAAQLRCVDVENWTCRRAREFDVQRDKASKLKNGSGRHVALHNSEVVQEAIREEN